MDYNSGPPQPGYAPSNVGPINPGYAPSQVSSPPPGMGMGMGGGPPTYDQQPETYQNHPANQPNCLSRNNPFEKANTVTDDIYFNASYKRVMGVAIVSIIAAAIGSLVVTGAGCLFINVAPVFHLFPIFLPSCNRFATPFYWAIIFMASVVLMGVTFFFGLLDDCITEAGILFGITLVIEGVGIFLLYKMDPTLKDKVKYCFASCGCLGNEAQMQTMVPKETTYTSPNLPPQGPGGPQNFQGYDTGMGPGSYVGDRSGGANAYQSSSGYASYPAAVAQQPSFAPSPPASVASGYSSPSARGYQSDTLKSSGKGGFMIDAPAEYDGSSKVGY